MYILLVLYKLIKIRFYHDYFSFLSVICTKWVYNQITVHHNRYYNIIMPQSLAWNLYRVVNVLDVQHACRIVPRPIPSFLMFDAGGGGAIYKCKINAQCH